MALKVGTVVLENYNIKWKEMYKEEKKIKEELCEKYSMIGKFILLVKMVLYKI